MGVTTRTRSVVVLVAALAVIAIVGGAVWAFKGRGETRSVEKLCAQLASVTSLSSALVTLDPTTLGPQVAELERAVDVAPSDIAPDLAVLATFVEEVADLVRASPVDKKAALTSALAERQDRIDQVTASGRAVEQWSVDNCGAPLRTTTSQRVTTTTRR